MLHGTGRLHAHRNDNVIITVSHSWISCCGVSQAEAVLADRQEAQIVAAFELLMAKLQLLHSPRPAADAEVSPWTPLYCTSVYTTSVTLTLSWPKDLQGCCNLLVSSWFTYPVLCSAFQWSQCQSRSICRRSPPSLFLRDEVPISRIAVESDDSAVKE